MKASGPSAITTPASSAADTRKTMAESARKASSRAQNPAYCVPVGSDIVLVPPEPSLCLLCQWNQGTIHYRVLRNGLQRLPNGCEQAIDLWLFDDERRRQGDDVAGDTSQHAAFEGADESFVGAPARRAGTRLELD